MRLYDLIRQYTETNVLPMHMPGHKRQSYDFLSFSAETDLTEIPGFDRLDSHAGAIGEAEAFAAQCYGCQRAFFLVNGSTVGILAAIGACAKPGGRVLVARNCHKSVYSALELFRLTPVFLPVPQTPEGIFLAPDPETFSALLTPELCCAVVTSPTYEGVLADIPALSQLAHRASVPLICDAAHGAHLGFTEDFPAFPKEADLIVTSLHKTMPCLTQTALLLWNGGAAEARVEHLLSMLQTSSPSFPLMAAMDGCLRYAGTHPEDFRSWRASLDGFQAGLTAFPLLKSRHIAATDPSRLTVLTAGTEYTGTALAGKLRARGIETEYAAPGFLVALTALGDRPENLHQLLLQLEALAPQQRGLPCSACTLPPAMPCECSPAEALEGDAETVSWENAVNRLSAGSLWAYPPGIPVVIPGQRITREVLLWLSSCRTCGIEVVSSDPCGARVLREKR